MRQIRPFTLVATLAILLAAPRFAAAQATGEISGTVVDPSDQVLPGASVTLTDESTLDHRTLAADARGEFSFRAVGPGRYTVDVEMSGFRKYSRRNTVVEANSQITLGRIKLE